jgi:LmbE family N-acetylglucosaminyl deacetylase
MRRPAPTPPPGETTRVDAPSALVVAPHADDETIGCGGLLLQLADRGAALRVLYLTDSAGPSADAAYAGRRRAETEEAARLLGVTGVDRAELPDGRLAEHVETAAAAIARALLSQRPRLLLVPSPVEVSADHRAAFAAAHRALLERLEADGAAAELPTVLLYEVNRPLHPDLLVDVSAELPRLERALAAYRSQDELHPYGRAALGLRRFRTLTLAAPVEAAEAYRRLRPQELTTRGLASLVEELGGASDLAAEPAGPRISVVVRTRDRPALLAQALSSLAASRYRNLEVVLVNDGGAPPRIPEGFPFPVVRIDHPRSRGRAAAANAGLAAATGDAVAFLDDDDRVEPEHFSTLAGLARETSSPVVYSDAAVVVLEPDPETGWREVERRVVYSRDFDPDLLLVDNYIPLHTLLIDKASAAAAGPLDETLEFFEDWDWLLRLAERHRFLHLARVTCEYRHFRGSAHHALGESPRARPDFLAVKARVLAKHAAKLDADRLARVVDRLRAEAVHAALRADAAERAHAETAERTAAEIRSLYAAAETQTAQVARLYGEIERLNGLIHAMEGTRAWRAHQWWQRQRRRGGGGPTG